MSLPFSLRRKMFAFAVKKKLCVLPLLLSSLPFLPFVSGAAQTKAGKATVPGELIADAPTLHALAFRWQIRGDDNGNATVTVRYRKAGTKLWRPALPLLRINRETVGLQDATFQCGNYFAGSVLNLEPDTAYDVDFALRDPDGGTAERTLTPRTRREPPIYRGERQFHVYPPAYSGSKAAPFLPSLSEACRMAKSGDVVLIHAGIYAGPVQISASGTANKPIVFRGVGDGEAVLTNAASTDAHSIVFDAQGTRNIMLEGLTLRSGYVGVKANGATALTVRNCHIEDVSNGIISYTTEAEGWYLADNTITGRIKNWFPRTDSNDTGVNIGGSGHVVTHNRISHFWDGISTDNHGPNRAEWATALHPPQIADDIEANAISECLDDGIEADDTLGNIRVMGNFLFNVHTGISAQPELGGPLYLIRNAVYNTTYAPLKLHNRPSGLLVFHNTFVGSSQGFESWPAQWRNATFRNNLFVGEEGYAMQTGSPDPRTSLDYDGWRQASPAPRFISWSSDGEKTWAKFATLAAFAKVTGQETHGVLVDYADFVHVAPPIKGHTYTLHEIDLRLAPGSRARGHGVALPTVNDGERGSAPDLGCCPFGAPPIQYGPRPMHKASVVPAAQK